MRRPIPLTRSGVPAPASDSIHAGRGHRAGDSRLLAKERQRVIVSQLREAGSVRVAELARALNVTEETIRRDLEKLDREGKLVRTHGGAMPLDEIGGELPFTVRSIDHLEAKREIARAALQHVEEGDVLALDASSTAYELARILPDVPLTVITNSLAIPICLWKRTQIRIVMSGGSLDAPSLSFVGPLAEEFLRRFHVRKLFFSTKGIDPERGLSVGADEHARIKRCMLDFADTRYLLADHSKFGAKALVYFAGLSDVDQVITDSATEPRWLEAFASQKSGGGRA